MKKNIPAILILLFLFESCFFNDYSTPKNDTKEKYNSFLLKNKKGLDIIANQCYNLNIKYVVTDSLLKIFKTDTLEEIIKGIAYLHFNYLPDYVACDFKLKIKENKCVDFFLTRFFQSKNKDTLWEVKVVDKSPCF
jgi:hypothetical protein